MWLTDKLLNHYIAFQRWNFKIEINFRVREIFFFNKSYSRLVLMPKMTYFKMTANTNDRSFWEVLLIMILNDIFHDRFVDSDLSFNWLQMHEALNESVLAEIIISRVQLDKAPVTTTIVENEMSRSRRASATTMPLSFWKTPERKLSLTLIRRHVTAILIESPPVPDEKRQRGL